MTSVGRSNQALHSLSSGASLLPSRVEQCDSWCSPALVAALPGRRAHDHRPFYPSTSLPPALPFPPPGLPIPSRMSSLPTSAASGVYEVEASDVIKLILQFCKENNLHRTLHTLQSESQVAMNSVDSMENFLSDVTQGRWDSVLPQAAGLQLPQDKLLALYEQVRGLGERHLGRGTPTEGKPCRLFLPFLCSCIVGIPSKGSTVSISSMLSGLKVPHDPNPYVTRRSG